MMVFTADTGIQIQPVLAVRVYNVYENTIYSIPPIMPAMHIQRGRISGHGPRVLEASPVGDIRLGRHR